MVDGCDLDVAFSHPDFAVRDWVLDAVVCAWMGFGAPRIDLRALAELSSLLVAQGFRRSSAHGICAVPREPGAPWVRGSPGKAPLCPAPYDSCIL